jgi:uncharacterized protein (TIGR02246 family)
MTKAFIGLSAVVLATSISFAQTPPQPPAPAGAETLADVRRAIDRGNAQWAEGWAKGDAAMVAAIFADDGVQLAGNGKIIKGPQQIRDRQKAAMQGADPGVKVTITTVSVWLDGDTAYETGKYKYEYKEKGKPGVDEGRYVTIWKHQKDGSWKLSMDMGVPQ